MPSPMGPTGFLQQWDVKGFVGTGRRNESSGSPLKVRSRRRPRGLAGRANRRIPATAPCLDAPHAALWERLVRIRLRFRLLPISSVPDPCAGAAAQPRSGSIHPVTVHHPWIPLMPVTSSMPATLAFPPSSRRNTGMAPEAGSGKRRCPRGLARPGIAAALTLATALIAPHG